jgi:hypothetical protein
MKLHLTSLAMAVPAILLLAQGVAVADDPTTADCLAASDSSLKSGNQHKLRAERSQLLVCAASTCPSDIRKDCASRVEEVNKQIPTIIFAVKDASGADVSAVRVTMDTELLTERLEGTAISIDPGEHTFTFEIPGQSAVTRKLLIQEAQKERREVIVFGAPIGTSGPTPAQKFTGDQTPQGADQSPGLGTQKILALVAGGIGVVGLGVGTAFGVMAMSKKNDAQSACPGQCSTADGVSKWSDAGSAGNISTIAFIVGGVGVAGAAVLWFTAPSTSGGTGTQVGLGPGVLQVKGSW